MSDEQKVESETTEKDSETSEETKETEEKSEESKESEDEHIDYQALYEEERTRRTKAESVIQRHKSKPKEEAGDEELSSAVDPDAIRTVIREELDERFSTLSSQLRGKEVTEAIANVATNPKLAALVKYHFDNSIRQTGDLELDVENALALANKRKVQSQLEELKASVISKETRSSGSQTGRRQSSEGEAELPSLTEVDRKMVNDLRARYVLSNEAIRQILKGERLENLLEKGIVKKR